MDLMLKPYMQISSSDVAMEVRYHMYVGKSGKRWLVGDCLNPSEYVWKDGGKGSQGMAGRTITFTLVDGSKVDFIGPWSLSATDLFEDTKIDVRGTTYSYYILAMRRESRPHPTCSWATQEWMIDVMYHDEKPMRFVDRTGEHPETMAQRIADELGHSVQLHWDTRACSCTKPVNPTDPATGKPGRYVAPPVKEVSDEG